jgi:DNA mismatch repair protein MutL
MNMAQSIKLLPENLANKIAAGEVIQRPASAIKELLENAVDAHATSITIVIKDGGKTLLHVIDNGDGMTMEDARLAFHRHATSKISSYEDLENIRTFGFRGEALASIAAVSQVEMKTRHRYSEVGVKVRTDGGAEITVSEESYAEGTSIQVKNLFFNTPGRRNFLKSNLTEYKHIYDQIQRVAIAYPEIGVKFISDDETILHLQPSDPEERMRAFFGEKLTDALIRFEETTDILILHGYLAKPDFARKGRAEQYLFLNRRFILNRNINHAVFQAYENLLEKGSFPLFVLFLTIDPKKVDVNVHPTKMEVKFEDEGAIYRMVVSTVRKALSAHDLVPRIAMNNQMQTLPQDFAFSQIPSIERMQQRGNWNELLRSASAGEKPIFQTDVPVGRRDSFNNQPFDVSGIATQGRVDGMPSIESGGFQTAWQIHNKYIVVSMDTGMMIVDQHAAHERVLYERVLSRFNQKEPHSQQLLFPQTVQLTPGNAAIVQSLLPFLANLGFSLKMFGPTTVIVDGVPTDVRPGEEHHILQNIIDGYSEDEYSVKLEPRERLAKSFSCKAAIKSGDPLKPDEIHGLLHQLFACEIPFVCPHGRPVVIKISLTELDQRFGRTS